MRICTRCNRELTNPEYHDIESIGVAPPPLVGWYQGHPVYDVPDDWEPRPRFRAYTCKVRLVGTSPRTGKTIVPRSAIRIKENDARYVQESLLEGV